MSIRLEFIEKSLGSVDREYRKAFNQILVEEASDAIAQLQAASPVGATQELRNNWRLIYPRRQTVTFDVEYKLENTATNAYNRIFGRAPGAMPPNAPIERWVAYKYNLSGARLRSRTYAIRRKIGREGTERYKQGLAGTPNQLGIKRDLSVEPGSALDVMELNIVIRLNNLKL